MKEKIINYLQEKGKSSVDDLASSLNMAGAKKFPSLIKEISSLESKGKLRFERDGTISLRKKIEKKDQITVKGIFRANKAGFGFVTVDEAEEDLFVGRNDTGYAIDGDTVEVVIKKVANHLKGTAAEARVVKIAEHGLKTVVGRFVLDDEKPHYAGYIKSKNQKSAKKFTSKKNPLF